MTRTPRILGFAAGGAAVLAIALSGGNVGAASRTCQVSGTVTFKPGLTMKNKGTALLMEGAVHNCVGAPTLRAPFGAHGYGDALSCKGGKSVGHAFIDWPTGNGSSVPFDANSTGQVWTLSGKVNYGQYYGATMHAVIRMNYPELRCRTSGGATSGTFSGKLTL